LAHVAVAAPYEKWLLDCLVAYLEEAGLRVLSAVGLGEQANVRHSPREALDLALRAWTPQADGLILSCGNFRSLEAIPEIERHLGKPMIGSNSAALWGALSAVQWRGRIPHAGRLLRDGGAASAAGGKPHAVMVEE
jgi:maleate cis-trans isomerase